LTFTVKVRSLVRLIIIGAVILGFCRYYRWNLTLAWNDTSCPSCNTIAFSIVRPIIDNISWSKWLCEVAWKPPFSCCCIDRCICASYWLISERLWALTVQQWLPSVRLNTTTPCWVNELVLWNSHLCSLVSAVTLKSPLSGSSIQSYIQTGTWWVLNLWSPWAPEHWRTATIVINLPRSSIIDENTVAFICIQGGIPNLYSSLSISAVTYFTHNSRRWRCWVINACCYIRAKASLVTTTYIDV
jgi:hypothetical protein